MGIISRGRRARRGMMGRVRRGLMVRVRRGLTSHGRKDNMDRVRKVSTGHGRRVSSIQAGSRVKRARVISGRIGARNSRDRTAK